MAKVMIFIDGSWLYRNTRHLCSSHGRENYRVDFGKLPNVLTSALAAAKPGLELDIVRTCLFGSIPGNFDPADEDLVEKQRDFFDLLKEEHHYEVQLFTVDFLGKRVRPTDRSQNEQFEPRENCVDVALASTMFFYAAMPQAYDIALLLIGERAFLPALKSVRLLGKRVAIASIKGRCASSLSDPADRENVKDYDVIWLDDHLDDLEQKYERHQLQCQSPKHQGPKLVWTDFHPRKGRKFFCEECRKAYQAEKENLDAESGFNSDFSEGGFFNPSTSELGSTIDGEVFRVIADKGYGFIRASDGEDYFFHLSDLDPTAEFTTLDPGQPVIFEVKRLRTADKAGMAGNVRLI